MASSLSVRVIPVSFLQSQSVGRIDEVISVLKHSDTKSKNGSDGLCPWEGKMPIAIPSDVTNSPQTQSLPLLLSCYPTYPSQWYVSHDIGSVSLLCSLGELEKPCPVYLGILRANAAPGTALAPSVFVKEIICQTFLLPESTDSTQHNLLFRQFSC